jgi:hypothetical protein
MAFPLPDHEVRWQPPGETCLIPGEALPVDSARYNC